MAKPKSAKKRMGRPIKPPKEGERVQLGLRVTPEMKRRLEAAATKRGRSLSQEAEMRLETSLASDKYLTMSRAGESSPVMFHGNEMIIYVGEWNVVVIPITPEQKEDLRNAFDPKRMAQEWKDAEEGGYL